MPSQTRRGGHASPARCPSFHARRSHAPSGRRSGLASQRRDAASAWRAPPRHHDVPNAVPAAGSIAVRSTSTASEREFGDARRASADAIALRDPRGTAARGRSILLRSASAARARARARAALCRRRPPVPRASPLRARRGRRRAAPPGDVDGRGSQCVGRGAAFVVRVGSATCCGPTPAHEPKREHSARSSTPAPPSSRASHRALGACAAPQARRRVGRRWPRCPSPRDCAASLPTCRRARGAAILDVPPSAALDGGRSRHLRRRRLVTLRRAEIDCCGRSPAWRWRLDVEGRMVELQAKDDRSRFSSASAQHARMAAAAAEPDARVSSVAGARGDDRRHEPRRDWGASSLAARGSRASAA